MFEMLDRQASAAGNRTEVLTVAVIGVLVRRTFIDTILARRGLP
jgi:hypothetical protein